MNTATAEAPTTTEKRVKQKTGPKPKPEMRREARLTSGTRKDSKKKFIAIADELGLSESLFIRQVLNKGLAAMGYNLTV